MTPRPPGRGRHRSRVLVDKGGRASGAEEKRVRKAASEAAYAALETGGYCSFTYERWLGIYIDTDVPTSTDGDA